jgi:hypothetical protein
MAYRFDVPMRYVSGVEVPDSFDYTQKLHSNGRRGEPMLGAGGTSKLTKDNRSTSGWVSTYSVMFP